MERGPHGGRSSEHSIRRTPDEGARGWAHPRPALTASPRKLESRTRSDIRRHAWVAIVGSTGVAFAVLPWLALRLRAGIALGLLRREFTLLGAPLGTTGPVDGRLGLGVELRLP